MPSEETWQQWLERFYNLRRDKHGSYERPHKPALLLAIFDLLDRGILTRNTVPFSPELIETFKRYFAAVARPGDKPTIENPFFFLSGDGFWHVVPNGGGNPLYVKGKASSPPPISVLRQHHGRFDDALWTALISDATARHQLREALISRYFPEKAKRNALAALAIHPASPFETVALRETPQPPGRNGAFRHTILELYDYRCAACGIRVRITDDLSLVEAAHIVPFNESRNDKPDNGLALCPNHHWAMDRFLIAPCPDPESKNRAGIWRVGSLLDARIEGQKDLIAIENQPVIPPGDKLFYPAIENLRWRERHLNARYSSDRQYPPEVNQP